MPTNRNDPCPCGSGKKYKLCHLDADTARERSLRLVQSEGERAKSERAGVAVSVDVLRSLDESSVWELDAVPVPLAIEGEASARTCVLLVVADGYVLDAHITQSPPTEPVDVASTLVQWLRAVVERHRVESGVTLEMPATVRVRHAIVANHMATMLGAATRVEHAPILPQLDHAARGMRENLVGPEWADHDEQDIPAAPLSNRPGLTLLCFPQVWSAWGFDAEAQSQLFAAAARFYEAQPWTRLDNEETLAVTLVDAPDATWTACVMGAAGEQYGLGLYEYDADFARQLTNDDPRDSLRGLDGAVLTVYFDARPSLPRAMQQEFKQLRFHVAGPSAYPSLSAANTPAGGISRAQLLLLTRALDAVARLITTPDALPEEKLPRATPIVWRDVALGVQLAYRGNRSPVVVSPWIVPLALTRGFADGDGVDASKTFARYEGTEADVDARFEFEIVRLKGFAEWLETRDVGRRRARAQETVAKQQVHATHFVEFLAFAHGVTVAAMHEYHLRSYLYSWLPTRTIDTMRNLLVILANLQLFFTWLERDGIVCAWASPMLTDHVAMQARFDTAPTEVSADHGERWWADQLSYDLYQRVMLAEPLMPEEPVGGDYEGEREALLHDELQWLTLNWRESQITLGITDPLLVRAHCTVQQRAWETTKHRQFGKSPLAVIRQERRKADRLP